MTGTPPSSVRTDLKSLASRSLIYGLGSVLLRTLNLLVLPFYTRHLTPAEYGIVALATTVSALLSIIFPLSLHNAVIREYFADKSQKARMRMVGSVWLAMLGSALLFSAACDIGGEMVLGYILPQLPFEPYARLAIWIAFFSTFSLIPLNLLQLKEQARTYVWWTSTSLLVNIGAVVLFVVILEKGAYGYLLGMLAANALLSVPYVFLTMRDAELSIDFSQVKKAFRLSLPLVPHGLASWVLSLSDRVILQIYVSLATIGVYSLGFQLGSIMIMVSGAITSAWVPFFLRRVAEEGDAANQSLSRIVTYYTLTVCMVAIGLCIFSHDVIVMLMPESYLAAQSVVPVVAIGYLWNSLYFIPANFLFAKARTSWLPVATIVAGVVNVGANFALVPHFGIMGAAWANFVAFFVMFIMMLTIGNSIFPFPYEYKRLGKVLGTTGLVIGLGMSVELPLVWDILAKIMLLLCVPVLLGIAGFFSADERNSIRSLLGAIGMRLRSEVNR